MQLTPLALQLMEYSNKDLGFGCLIQQHPHIKKISTYLGKETDDDSCMGSEFYYIFEKRSESPFGNHPVTYRDLDIHQGTDKIHNIYGSPYGRGRVCMLRQLYVKRNEGKEKQDERQTFLYLKFHFNKNPELYDMDCLSRPEETQLLVLDFLNSLSPNK